MISRGWQSQQQYGHTVAIKAATQHEDMQPQQWESSAMKKESAIAQDTLAPLFMNNSAHPKSLIFIINHEKSVHEK